MLASGKIKVGLTFARLAAGLKERAIDWYPPEPVIAYSYPTGLIQKHPHPASASLFLSFLFSTESERS